MNFGFIFSFFSMHASSSDTNKVFQWNLLWFRNWSFLGKYYSSLYWSSGILNKKKKTWINLKNLKVGHIIYDWYRSGCTRSKTSKHFPVQCTFVVTVHSCVCLYVSCLSVHFELIGTFYGHGYGLCLSVHFMFVHKFFGVVLVFNHFSCLSIHCIAYLRRCGK